jgi:hypothetical protein
MLLIRHAPGRRDADDDVEWITVMEVLHGVNEKYVYELRRNNGIAKELEPLTVMKASVENIRHYRMDKRARDAGYYYERKPRNS